MGDALDMMEKSLEEMRAKVKAVVAKHDNDYYTDAMNILEQDVRQFVEGTSWAAELHKDAVNELRTKEIMNVLRGEPKL